MRFIISSVLIIFCSLTLSAQSTWKVGVPLGITQSYLKGTLPSQSEDCRCTSFSSSDTSLLGVKIGGALIYVLSNNVGLSLTAGYYNTGNLISVVPGENLPSLVIIDGQQTIVRTTTQHYLQIHAQYATIQLTGRVNVWDSFHVVFGVGADVHVSSSLSQKLKIISTTDVQGKTIPNKPFVPDSRFKYEDDGRTAVLIEQTPMSNATPLLVSTVLGVDYDIKLSDGISIAPYVSVNTPLHSIRKDASYKMMSYSFGIQTLFDL